MRVYRVVQPEEFESRVHIAHQTPPVNVTLEKPEREPGQTYRAEDESREQGETRPLVTKEDTTGDKARPV